MHLWAEIALVLCVGAITAALVVTLAAVRRTAERAERVLALVEHDVPPLLGEIRDTAKELLAMSRQARTDFDRVGVLIERAGDAADGIARIAGAIAGFTRAGQLVGLAAGLKTGVDVFLHRLRQQGDDHGERT